MKVSSRGVLAAGQAVDRLLELREDVEKRAQEAADKVRAAGREQEARLLGRVPAEQRERLERMLAIAAPTEPETATELAEEPSEDERPADAPKQKSKTRRRGARSRGQ